MNWLDMTIMVVLAAAAYTGYARGFLQVASEIGGILLGVLAASVVYAPAGTWLAQTFSWPPFLVKLLVFGLVFVTVERIYTTLMHPLVDHRPGALSRSLPGRLAGSAANLVKWVAIVTLSLTVFAAFPLNAAFKESALGGQIPRRLLAYTGSWQQGLNRALGDRLHETLTFFTVPTTSQERVDLGFTTADVRVAAAAEQEMLRLVNLERAHRGLNPLGIDPALRDLARDYSRDMLARGYFAHVDPDGRDPFDRMNGRGIAYLAAGENLALAPTVRIAHAGLMNSPGHRANILSPDYGVIGIGAIDAGPYGIMFTQEFKN